MTTTQPTPTPETTQIPEQQETPTNKLSITLLPIENKEDKFSYITNKSIFSNLTEYSEIEKLKIINHTSNNNKYLSNEQSKTNLQETLYKKLGELGYSGYIDWRKIGKSGVLLFQAQNIEIQGPFIIIKDEFNNQYITKTEDYLATGLRTLKVANQGEINQTLTQQKQIETYFLQGHLLNIKTQKQLLNIGADDYCITREDQKQFCVLKDNHITLHEYTDDAINTISSTYDLSEYGAIKNIRTDVNNNFYFIIAEQEGKSQLKVLNRKTLEDIMNFPDLTEIVYLSNEQGKLFCMDKDGYLRIIIINTKQLPRGYVDTNTLNVETTKQSIIKIEDKSRRDLQEAIEKGLTLDLNENTTTNTQENNNDEKLRKSLRNTPLIKGGNEAEGEAGGSDKKSTHTLRKAFDEAKTLPEINRVYALAQQLKMNPKVMAVKGLIDPILTTISEKREKIRLETISHNLANIVETLKTATEFSDFLALKQQLTDIRKERSQTLLPDKEFDMLLKETIQTNDEKIKEYQTSHQEDIQNQLEENLKEIQNELSNIDYLPHINTILKHPLRIETEQLINYLPEEEKKAMKDKLANLRKYRMNQLQTLSKAETDHQKKEQEQKLFDTQNALKEITMLVQSINDEDTLEQLEKSDSQVLAVREAIDELPANKAQELSIKLDQIFKERALSIKFSTEGTKESFKTLDQYGIPKALYFVPEIEKKVKRNIYGKPLADGTYRLQFRSSAGNIIEPNVNKRILGNYKFTYTFKEREALKKNIHERNTNGSKKKYQDLLKEYQALKREERKNWSKTEEFQEIEKKYYIPRMLETMNQITGENKLRNIHQRKNLPHIDSKTVITPSVQDRLANRGNVLSQQIANKQGYMVIESEAGTGKNFKLDIIGHLTNREIFEISCNAHMEKEDLLFSQEINTDGTYRQPSELIRGIQTPGAIIFLDEVNTLKPGVTKLLNPLLDGRRYINDPQLGKVHVHPSVIIMGATNPRDYLGTNPLPQEQISRAIFVNDEYLPANEEAFMISKHVDSTLATLTWEEFKTYWEQYNVRDEKPNNKTLYNVFKDMEKVVNVAKKLRDVALKTKRGKAEIGEELDWLYSPRESIQIIRSYNFTKDIKKSIENIVLPKIADFEQREYAKDVIKKTIE